MHVTTPPKTFSTSFLTDKLVADYKDMHLLCLHCHLWFSLSSCLGAVNSFSLGAVVVCFAHCLLLVCSPWPTLWLPIPSGQRSSFWICFWANHCCDLLLYGEPLCGLPAWSVYVNFRFLGPMYLTHYVHVHCYEWINYFIFYLFHFINNYTRDCCSSSKDSPSTWTLMHHH
jgi:hypothetical protein